METVYGYFFGVCSEGAVVFFVCLFVFYHSRDECQGAGVISNRDKSVTFGQIPVEANVCCNAPSAVDGVVGVALAVDGGLKLVNGGKPLGTIIKGNDESFFFLTALVSCTIFLFLSPSSRGTARAEIIPLLMFRIVVVSPSSGYSFTSYMPSTTTFRGYLKSKAWFFFFLRHPEITDPQNK